VKVQKEKLPKKTVQERYNSDPKFRRWLYRFDTGTKYFFIASNISTIIVIAIFLMLLYVNLPESIRAPSTSIVAFALSFVAVPLSIERYKENREQKKLNKQAFVELTKAMLQSFENGRVNPEKCHIFLCDFLKVYNAEMYLSFSISIIEEIRAVLLESDEKGDQEHLAEHIGKCINLMRKELGGKKKVYLAGSILIAANSNYNPMSPTTK
jgi:hypothetical protein